MCTLVVIFYYVRTFHVFVSQFWQFSDSFIFLLSELDVSSYSLTGLNTTDFMTTTTHDKTDLIERYIEFYHIKQLKKLWTALH